MCCIYERQKLLEEMKERAFEAPIRQHVQSLYFQKIENDSTDVEV